MLACTQTPALLGLEGKMVKIEVFVSQGLPSFEIVGLPDTAVREARERVRAAIKNGGWEFPLMRILVNLAPADMRKEGSYFDLPIALALLQATGQIKCNLEDWVFMGELSLEGEVRPVPGVLPSAIVTMRSGGRKIMVPGANGQEGALVENLDVYPVHSLKQAVGIVTGKVKSKPAGYSPVKNAGISLPDLGDMAEVQGQAGAKRALEVAAAGGHNVLMIGPPGSGKTMLARRLITILPEMTREEALETTTIFSVVGQLNGQNPLLQARPFRSPHHSSSMASLIGGGNNPRPGEISLAHLGVLYLDEFPEFKRDALKALRQPLEDGTVTVCRVNATATFPAKMMLVGSMNPCPCGYWGDEEKECSCTPYQIQRYFNRISGPLLDRIDIHLPVARLTYEDLTVNRRGESSSSIRERVERAREVQRQRLQKRGLKCNAHLGVKEIREFCRLEGAAAELMQSAFQRLKLSARAHHKILKVARTVADLAGSPHIEASHLAEAIQYRTLDRPQW